VKVSVKKAIFEQSGKESTYVRNEITKLLKISKSDIENVHITSGRNLAIRFATSVSRTNVQNYISQVESSTLSSYTGRTSSVQSATYSSSSSSSGSSSYRNVHISVKKTIFQQSNKESSYVRSQISKLLNIQKSAIRNVQITSGKTIAIRFAKSVSRTNVQNYISQVESSTLSSYTGRTSSVTSAHYSSSSSHSSGSSYRSVSVSVKKSIFKQSSRESSYVRTELSKLLNIRKSAIDHVQITSGKTLAIRFAKTVSRTNVQNYISQVESSTLSSYTGRSSSVYSATYSSSTSSSNNHSYRNVNVSVKKSIFQHSSKESSHVRTEISNLLNIQKSLIRNVQIISGRSLAIRFAKTVSRTDVQNYISQVESSTLTSYTGLSSSVTSATYSSSTSHSSGSSYRNVNVSVKKSIFQQSSQESSHVRTEISKLLNIQKSSIEHVQITSGKTLAIRFGHSVSRSNVQSYISQVESSTLSSYTGRTSIVQSAHYSSSTSTSGTSSYRNVNVSVRKSIFKQSSQESSHVRNEISKILNIQKNLINSVQIVSGKTLGIHFSKSVSRSDVSNYLSIVKSSTITSYTGGSSTVVTATYSSSSTTSSTSSYRNVNVSVRKSIFKQSSREESHVRSEISRILNIQKSLIKHVQVTSGKTLAIRFSKSVSRSDVSNYVSTVESSTISSYTGGSSSVVSATYHSSTSSTSQSSYRNVDISVKKSIFEQSGQESSYVRKEISKILNIQSSLIKNVQIRSGKTLGIHFSNRVSRTDVSNYLSIVKSSTISSYTGQSSTVTSATYSSSSSHSSGSSYRNVKVSVKKSIFQQSSKESSYVRNHIAQLLNIKKSAIENVQITSGEVDFFYRTSIISKAQRTKYN
jgi:acyl-CoA synthetase (NDP forming)